MQVKSVFYIFLIIALPGLMIAADTTHIRVGWNGHSYYPGDQGPRIALALSGGGARGFAQVGILKAFEESGISIGAIAGTSIGGIVGGLYASGYSSDELEAIVKKIDFNELFSNRPSRTTMLLTQREEMERYLISVRFDGLKPFIPQALTSGQKLSDLLTDLTLKANYISCGEFDRLKIPFYAVTTDIVAGEKVVIESGNLADAMRSTMAFPLAFTGVETEERLLMDGGMLDPIPVETVAEIAPDLDLIVAVNTTSELLPKDKINNPIDIANQVTSIMSIDKVETSLNAADIVIKPDIEGYRPSDFNRIDELIRRGYESGIMAANEIYEQCAQRCNRDSIFAKSIRFDLYGLDPGGADYFSTADSLVSIEDIRMAAAELYRRHAVLSVIVRIIRHDVGVDGYSTADIEIEAVGVPAADGLRLLIEGNTVFDDTTIAAFIPHDDNLLTAEDLLLFSDSLISMYESKGYDLAHIRNLQYDPDSSVLMIDIDEAKVRRIMVIGNERTKQWLIKSNYPQRIDEPFNSKIARNGIANIFATDLFDRVIINAVPDQDGAIVQITVKEKKYTQVRLGWHLHDEYKNEAFLELLDDNLFGTGQELLSHAQYSTRRQKYEITLKADRFFSTYFTYNLNLFYHYKQQDIYDINGDKTAGREEDRYGVEFSMGHQIARFGTVSAGIGLTEIENDYSPANSSDRVKLRTITLKSRVETINRYPFPTAGKKHLFLAQFATDILGAEARYNKLYSLIESYWALPAGLNFHPTISIGLTDAGAGIPVAERFYIGGHYSFYGFAYEELIGAKMILGNLELRLKLPYRFYLYGRYDMGQVYGAFDDIKIDNLRHGFGFSLAFDSPLGPVDFGWGKSGSHPDRLYLDIGLAF